MQDKAVGATDLGQQFRGLWIGMESRPAPAMGNLVISAVRQPGALGPVLGDRPDSVNRLATDASGQSLGQPGDRTLRTMLRFCIERQNTGLRSE